jgi:hypothetical protein
MGLEPRFYSITAEEAAGAVSVPCLPPFHRKQIIEALAHGFLQIVVGPAEFSVAAGDELILLALHGTA